MTRELLDLDPGRYTGLFKCLAVFAALQDFERAEPFLERIVELNPADGLLSEWLVLYLNGRTAEAAALVDRRLPVDPDPNSYSHNRAAGVVALFDGESRAAARHLERAYEVAPPHYLRGHLSSVGQDRLATLLGYAHLKTGNEERALRLFQETEQYYTDRIARGDTSYLARLGIAAVDALRGDKEAAYGWLQQAIDAGFYAYAELERHFFFESLHGEERFQRMMDGVEARVEEARRRVDAMEASV